MATGQVLFQRFFYAKSFVRHDVEVSRFSIFVKVEFCFVLYCCAWQTVFRGFSSLITMKLGFDWLKKCFKTRQRY